MGSEEKAKAFLEASEASNHYATVIDFSFNYFVKKAEAMDSQVAEGLKKIKDAYPEEFAKSIGIAEEVYSEMFTDEELDELIVIHNNPVLKKLRNSTAQLMDKISAKII